MVPVFVLVLMLSGVIAYADRAGQAFAASAPEPSLNALPGHDLHDVHAGLASMVDRSYGPMAAEGPYEGVPVCTDHNPAKWHPLVRRDAAGKVTCTYTHEHHDDPAAVNDIFGAPGAWYGSTDSISYPWMTIHATTGAPENSAKHEGYKWFVRRGLPCAPFGGTPACIIAYRTQVHMRGDVSDQTTRFHSFLVEAQVQDPQGRRGIVRHGGHLDTGILTSFVDQGRGLVCPPLEGQIPPGYVFTCPTTNSGIMRESSSLHAPAPHTDWSHPTPNWYTTHGITNVSVQLEQWGPIDYQNPTIQAFFPSTQLKNNSRGRVEGMGVLLRGRGLPTDASGLIRTKVYTDRSGKVVGGCGSPSVDCVPLSVEGFPPIDARLSANTGPAVFKEVREYDVASPVTGKSLIRFPN